MFFIGGYINCDKETVCKKFEPLHYKQDVALVDTLLKWILNNENVCLYNILSKESMKRYDFYTFSVITNTFPFKRLAYNLKNHRNKVECYMLSTSKDSDLEVRFKYNNVPNHKKQNIICAIFFKGVFIPLFFKIEKEKYIDEYTGKVKKEEKLVLDFDFDYYITLLNNVKKRYNINFFYDYHRKRGDD